MMAVILIIALVILSGCSMQPQKSQDIVIAASFYPVYIFTLNLVEGIDGVEVMCMAEQNIGCLHDYTLTAKDAKIADDADVLVINGAGMELFIQDIYDTVGDISVIDSSEGIELICSGGHDHHHEGEHEGHSHEHNSHIWMSVDNAKVQVGNIKNGLVERYPQFADQIEANYSEYMLRLDELSQDIENASATVEDAHVMSFHDAYAYIANDLGFHIVGTVENGDGGEPSAKELAALTEKIRDHKVKALFVEPDNSGSAAEILSAETGVKVYTLNPVTSGNGTLTSYEDVMRSNINTILEAVR